MTRPAGIATLTPIQAHALRIYAAGGRSSVLDSYDLGFLWRSFPGTPDVKDVSAGDAIDAVDELAHAGYLERVGNLFRITWRGVRKAAQLPDPPKDNRPPL